MRLVSLSTAFLAASVSGFAVPQAFAQAQAPIVAVVDTGVDLTHSEFAGRILTGACFGSTTTCTSAVRFGDDNNNHGSHVAGIIGAANNGVGNTGVAPTVRILPVKVLNASGSGDLNSIARGIDFARTNGARVINLSLGGGGGNQTLLTSLRAARANSVIVAAAGNQGNSFRPLWPAAYATDSQVLGGMLIVGSVGSTNVISRFSNTPGTGGCVSTSQGQRCWRDFFVVAPGEGILSTGKDGNYLRMSGTSMATPFVAGVAARVLQDSPFLTSDQVVDIIKRSAIDLGASGVDGVYGWGLVSLTAALNPVGGARVATSGGSTMGFAGTQNTGVSGLRAPWAAPVVNSTVAANAIMFDAYGRDFAADLPVRAASNAFSAFAASAQVPASWDVKSFAAEGVAMRAAVTDTEVNSVAALSSGGDREAGYDYFLVSARLTDTLDMTTGHRAPSAGLFNALDLAAGPAQDQMFLGAEALNSPYLSLADGGSFGGLTWRAGENWTLAAAYLSGGQADQGPVEPVNFAAAAQDQGLIPRNHLRSADAVMASAAYRASDDFTIGATLSLTDESNSLLGSDEMGALALTADAQTIAIGLQAKLALGDGWSATAAWSMGYSDVTPVANGLISSMSGVTSQAYGVALTKLGVFGDSDAFGVSVSRPLHMSGGSADVIASTGVTESREIIYGRERIDLASSAPETQIEAGYAMSFGDATRLSVSAIYQDNADGIEGRESVGAMLRLRTEF